MLFNAVLLFRYTDKPSTKNKQGLKAGEHFSVQINGNCPIFYLKKVTIFYNFVLYETEICQHVCEGSIN